MSEPRPKSGRPATYFHLHLISDATGETLNTVAKAASAQFDAGYPIIHSYALVRTRKHLDRVLRQVMDAPGIVIYTMVNDDLRAMLEEECKEANVPVLSVLDPIISLIGNYLGAETTHRPGGQHAMDEEYFDRIEALKYTMAHDDGQLGGDLELADILLVGVSRTSKTPTCIYLANRGYKAANVPIVMDVPLPGALENLKGPLIVGLTTSPDRLVDIRRNRLRSLDQRDNTSYTDPETVAAEVRFARRLYARKGWPVIDVSRRSIEETSAAILNLLSNRDT